MLKIGICDDNMFFLEQFKAQVKILFKKNNWTGSISSFKSGEEMIELCKNRKYDIVFLDIDMPGMDGFTLAERIPEKDTLLVFCTNHNELVYNSFSYQPFWFLCKENYENNLEEVFCAARKKIALRNRNYEFNINGEIYNASIDDIQFFDVSKHKIYVHFSDGHQIEFRDNLSHVDDLFKEYGFVRINSGCLINMLWIKHICQNDIELKDGTILSLSRGRKKDVKEKFHEYMRLKR